MSPQRLRDGSTVSDPRLGRLREFDERSLGFLVRPLLSGRREQLQTYLWTIPEGSPVLDQGMEGACVGFGVTNELRFSPVPIPNLDAHFAHDTIYWGAQRVDEWPGGSYPGASPQYEGTSVLAGIKTAQKLGYYGEYRWATSERDLALSVGHIGPAVLGVNWYEGMFHLDDEGYIRPTGDVAGGHCILCVGINVEHSYYTLYNSWGPDWGINGRAKISRGDMKHLLADDGEACIITQRFKP